MAGATAFHVEVVTKTSGVQLWWDGQYVGQVVPRLNGPGVEIHAAWPMTAVSDATMRFGSLTVTVTIDIPDEERTRR